MDSKNNWDTQGGIETKLFIAEFFSCSHEDMNPMVCGFRKHAISMPRMEIEGWMEYSPEKQREREKLAAIIFPSLMTRSKPNKVQIR